MIKVRGIFFALTQVYQIAKIHLLRKEKEKKEKEKKEKKTFDF